MKINISFSDSNGEKNMIENSKQEELDLDKMKRELSLSELESFY